MDIWSKFENWKQFFFNYKPNFFLFSIVKKSLANF